MSALSGRTRTAGLVVVVQNGVVAEAWSRDAVVANVATLVDKARSAGAPVVWVQHSGESLPQGSPQWDYVPELVRRDGEPLVHKRWPDAFEETDLEEVLARLEVARLVVAGAQTDECIRSTLHGAVVRGYDALLVADAHTTEDLSPYGAPPPEQVVAHTNLYWANHQAPGRTAGTVTTADVEPG